MCTVSQLNKITKRMADVYVKAYGKKLIAVYLYGSYARGDFDLESDIDIAAIVDDTRENVQKHLPMIWDESAELGLENDIIVSPVAIPQSEFELYGENLPYYRNIREEGRRVG